MFSVFLGFAQIRAQDIPEGVLPKRQVVGTGVSTSTSEPTSTADDDSAPTTSDNTPTETTASSDPPSDSPTSDTAATTDTPTTTDAPTTTSASPESTPSSTDADPTSTDDSPSSSPTASASPSETSDDEPSDSDSPDSSASRTPSSTTIDTVVPVTTTDSSGSTITSSVSTRTAVGASQTSSLVQTRSGKSSDFVVVGSSTINRSTLSSATTITSALVGEATQSYVTTTFWTSDGTVGSSVISTNRLVPTTTGFTTATVNPKLANGGGGAGSNNLTPHTKAIIGGVVGGIGGAILLGGIAVVAWRLWGKKKRERVPQDDFMDSRDDSIRREKRASTLGMGPPSTAGGESYLPGSGGPINTASNF